MEDLSKLCIHSITTPELKIEEIVEKYSNAGITAVSLWRNILKKDLAKTGELVRSYGLDIVSLVRGGFFPSVDSDKRKDQIEINYRMIMEATELNCPMVVLVCGADPKQPLTVSREQIKEGIEAILHSCEKNKIKIAIEPLHPMYADSRSAINTMEQANDLAEFFDSDSLGVAIDVYHTWWDPHLEREILRCGKSKNIFAFHICDWLSPTSHMLNDRGLMGEGCIPVKQIKKWVNDAGFSGYDEVEIFSERLWKESPDELIRKIKESYINLN